MTGRFMAASVLVLLLISYAAAAAEKPRRAVRCADLKWSEQVLAQNPDMGDMCRGVYEKDDVLYAKATIEVVRVQGSSLTFRPLLTDGSLGKRRKIKVDSHWRINLGGREYLLGDLIEGQRLNIYMPEDRFSLTVQDSNAAEPHAIENVEE